MLSSEVVPKLCIARLRLQSLSTMLFNEHLNFYFALFLSEHDDIDSVDGKVCDDIDLFTPRKVFDL